MSKREMFKELFGDFDETNLRPGVGFFDDLDVVTDDDDDEEESETVTITGVAVFKSLPDPEDDEFEFIIRGDKEYIAVLNRVETLGEDALFHNKMHRFSGKKRKGKIYISSFELLQDKGSKLNLFAKNCGRIPPHAKIALKISGFLTNIVIRNKIIDCQLCGDGVVYDCIFDKNLMTDETVDAFFSEVENAKDKMIYDSNVTYINSLDKSNEYSLEGVLIDDFFFIKRSIPNHSGLASNASSFEAYREKVASRAKGMSDMMKKEILHFISNRNLHPVTKQNETENFFMSSDLKKKFEICRETYPVTVQRAIDKALHDKSLKDSHRTAILRALVNTRWDDNLTLNTDVVAIKNGLDESHYGMENLKNQLIKLVLSNSKKVEKRGTNILLVGAPGVGKTSLVKRFAELYGIPFGKISLNGVDSPYYLKGTPRLYDNAIVGRVMRTVQKLGNNSMILLDEIDKMTIGKEGNPYTALYDLLDTEEPFQDEMIEAGIDLSNTIFLLTANDISVLPPAILDRVEVVYVDGYSADEKNRITLNYVIPKLCKQYGINPQNITWSKGAIGALSDHFTLTDGVRDIERNVLRVIKSLVLLQEKSGKTSFCVNEKNLKNLLDIKPVSRVGAVRDIASMKNKFQFFKTEYLPETRKKLCHLFAEYESSDAADKEVIKKRIFSLVNLLPHQAEKAVDISAVKSLLDSTHYGMTEIKEQILMHLCARQALKQRKTKCILLNGMCGIGKTTIAKTLAEALEMPFVKISLNGITAPENINGFEATWKNAEPGVIVKSLSELGTSTAFILLDEIDKMAKTAEKDPYAALLDLFDNAGGFRDSFCDAPIDLSDAFIMATSNYIENIPAPVLDRMEVIELGGYSKSEKVAIASSCVIPKKLMQYNLSDTVRFSDEVVSEMVGVYCKSYGMRDVEKATETIISRLLYENNGNIPPIEIERDTVCRILGAAPLARGNISQNTHPGMARALAVSGNTGTCFAIEVTENTQNDHDEITGLAKQSTADSVKIAKLLVSRKLGKKLPPLHIHFSEGGIEKDGPSAGITIFAAIYSYCTAKAISRDIGFTGEINLFGDVWAIGGAELKITAAINDGCTKVLLPYDNYQQLVQKNKLEQFPCKIIPVSGIDDVIRVLF